MFVTNMCAHFQAKPKEPYLIAVKCIFRYLKHTPNLGLWYPPDSAFEIFGYIDSDLAAKMTSPQPPSSPFSAGDESEVVHINRLPDELLLIIFTKLKNAKSLCICSLVSKRFSTVVHQTPSIFLTFPHRHSNDQNENLPKKLFKYLSKTLFRKPPQNKFDGALFQSAVNSLKSFQNIRNLQIQLPSFQQDESILKWHAEFGRDMNICVILFATSVHETTSSNDQIQNADTLLTNHLLQSRIATANQCFREATWRQHILRHVVENHRNSLDAAEIGDLSRKGKVVMRGKQQLTDLLDPEVKLPASGYGKLWHVQLLRLPELRCVLHGATVVAIRRTNENEEEHEDVGVKHLLKKGYEIDEQTNPPDELYSAGYIFDDEVKRECGGDVAVTWSPIRSIDRMSYIQPVTYLMTKQKGGCGCHVKSYMAQDGQSIDTRHPEVTKSIPEYMTSPATFVVTENSDVTGSKIDIDFIRIWCIWIVFSFKIFVFVAKSKCFWKKNKVFVAVRRCSSLFRSDSAFFSLKPVLGGTPAVLGGTPPVLGGD
ncbi:hypothetical protein LXL04_023257 [Taraxacum kok-saghyz]